MGFRKKKGSMELPWAIIGFFLIGYISFGAYIMPVKDFKKKKGSKELPWGHVLHGATFLNVIFLL